MSSLSELTVFIPMRNRNPYFDLQKEFWEVFPCRLVIVDNKRVTIQMKGFKEPIQVYSDSPNLQDRLRTSIKYLETPFTIWLGEDDLLEVYGMTKALECLVRNKAISDEKLAIYSAPREYDFRNLYSKYGHAEYKKRYDTNEINSLNRGKKFLSNPMDRHFYAVQESSVVKQVFEALTASRSLPDELWFRIFNPFLELGACLLQKTLADSNVWYLKGNKKFGPILFKDESSNSLKEATNLNKLIDDYSEELNRWLELYSSKLATETLDASEILAISKDLLNLICNREIESQNRHIGETEKLKARFVTDRAVGPIWLPQIFRSYVFIILRAFFRLYRIFIPYRIPWSFVILGRHSRARKMVSIYRVDK